MHAFSIHNDSIDDWQQQLVRIGVPLPRGECFDVDLLQISDAQGHVLPAHIRALTLWPDNSSQWCLLNFNIDLAAGAEAPVYLNKRDSGDSRTRPEYRPLTHQQDKQLSIITADHEFYINLADYDFLQCFDSQGNALTTDGHWRLDSDNHGSLQTVIEDCQHGSRHAGGQPLYASVQLQGVCNNADGQSVARFRANYLFHHASNTLHYSLTLHNPRRASHPDGIWDLGESQSLYISSLALGFVLDSEPQLHFRLADDDDWQQPQDARFSIYQASSGGRHWNSPNHKNRHNRVDLKHPGYLCHVDGQTRRGHRASPQLRLQTGTTFNFRLEQFWQQFPKAIEIDGREVSLGLFPRRFEDEIELQPGEQKTHRLQINLGDTRWQPRTPRIRLNPQWLNHCQVLPFDLVAAQYSPLQALINAGIDGDNNFFDKREAIDEYGWRHFGELFADHETAFHTKNQTGDELFISHYNNQYDPLYGFLMQYLRQGDARWLQLADDLARHVIDIDIYHTQEDKDDYNTGLFWHTDHYLDACTATHRSFSRHQPKDVYMDHAGGGGPGGQHGYTSGLLYHYLLTGNPDSRQAVFDLCDWLTRYYEGTEALLGFLNALKNRYRADLKDIMTGQYPLDRGTGNYINALMDKYILTRETGVLDQVADIIRHTVHPADDIALRRLEQIEENWFYTVFFQYLCRFLALKHQLGQLDDDFYYARDTLLHYADWMAEHEYPYLEKPEILEFPNQTWSAQDLRKVSVLYHAAFYAPGDANDSGNPGTAGARRYRDKADSLLTSLISNLQDSDERSYTRILAILMQNDSDRFLPDTRPEWPVPREYTPPPVMPAASEQVMRLLGMALTRLLKLSPKREISWLRRHTNLLDRFAGKRS